MLPDHCHSSVTVVHGEDLAVVRSAAERLAAGCGLGRDRKDRFNLVVAELGSNLVRHAEGGGTMLFRRIADPAGLECICLDRGPGMADPDRALRDGESSNHGLGLGLGAVQRLSDVFALHSIPGAETAIVARVCEKPRPPVGSGFDSGAVMVPMADPTDCGDGWVRTSNGMALVVDGLGHGELAARAARRAEAIAAEEHGDPASVLDAIHLALRGSRGAVAAAAIVTSDRIRFAGVGNIGAVVIGAATHTHLTNVWGVLGYNARSAPVLEAPWSVGDALVLHSDSIGRVTGVFADRHLRCVDPTDPAWVHLGQAA